VPEQTPGQDSGASVYLPYGASGGGGEGGDYVFTDLDELGAIITDLEALTEEIRNDGRGLNQATELATPPAEDSMSTGQASAYVASLNKAKTHNDAMAAYAQSQLDKLKAARTSYAETDAGATARLQAIDGADQ